MLHFKKPIRINRHEVFKRDSQKRMTNSNILSSMYRHYSIQKENIQQIFRGKHHSQNHSNTFSLHFDCSFFFFLEGGGSTLWIMGSANLSKIRTPHISHQTTISRTIASTSMVWKSFVESHHKGAEMETTRAFL